MNDLDQLESESIYILREAFNAFDNPAMLWSLGKDSNVMLWLARKAFFGRIPFPLVHVDTGNKFTEMYAFRDRYAKEWGIDLVTGDCPPLEDMDPDLPPATRRAARKTYGLKTLLERERYDGIFAGIRRDEEGTRAKERVFSPRNLDTEWDVRDQPPELWSQYNTDFPPGTHVRVHPILHWSEVDIWRYIEREEIPVVELYFSRSGQRYRSLGDQDITDPITSDAASVRDIIVELQETKIAERSGRAMDHEAEDSFERLRAEGYM